MSIAVVGAGIAGLATAVGLQRAGHDCVVYEEAPELRLSGAAVTLWPNGAGALVRLGVPVEGLGRRLDRLETRSADGRLLYAIDGRRLADRFGFPVSMVPRRDLVQRLADSLGPARIRFGWPCAGASPIDGAVVVHFRDRDAQRVALVVGADGHRSAVRRSVFDTDAAESTGWGEWQGLAAMRTELTDGPVAVVAVDQTGACGLLPAGRGLLQFWFALPGGREPGSNRSVLSTLRSCFGRWMEPIPMLLETLSASDMYYWPYVRHRVPRSLINSRVVLVGDAAHAMPPTLGQGANQALEDALALTTASARADTDVALATYDRARRQRVAIVSRLAPNTPAQDTTTWSTKLSAAAPTRLSTWVLGSLLRAASTALRTKHS
jgi:2-polyprenyl-6-methoxyphenol hydroxylase-like FAD-dependent oxidoreductase